MILGMTAETKYVADLSDIMAIRFECKCGTAFSQPPDKARDQLPLKCVVCGAEFFLDGSGDKVTAEAVVRVLRELTNLPNGQNWRIRLEMRSRSLIYHRCP
jgi:hypothetical protein